MAPEHATVPGISAVPELRVKVDAVMLAGSMFSLKVMLTTVPVPTPAAPGAGDEELIVGGVVSVAGGDSLTVTTRDELAEAFSLSATISLTVKLPASLNVISRDLPHICFLHHRRNPRCRYMAMSRGYGCLKIN